MKNREKTVKILLMMITLGLLQGCTTIYHYEYKNFRITGYKHFPESEIYFCDIMANNQYLYKTNSLGPNFSVYINGKYLTSNKDFDINFAKQYCYEKQEEKDIYAYPYIPPKSALYIIRPVSYKTNEQFQLLFDGDNKLIGYNINSGGKESLLSIGKDCGKGKVSETPCSMPLSKENVIEIFGKPIKIESYKSIK